MLEIFFTQISDDDLSIITNALKHTYGDIIDVRIRGTLELPNQAYHPQRNQYNADTLLRHALNQKEKDMALWVIPQDLYTRNMNFIFGLALYFQGAVLSIFRLSTKELREKEVIHEIGHVLGLTHCAHNCVMQYSNSLWEAQRKPSVLCDHCKHILNI
jgi:archaemetzincin